MDDEQHRHLRLVAEHEQEAEARTRAQRARAGPVRAHVKRRTALEMRAAGLTYEQIAEQMKEMGFRTSASGVAQLVKKALDRMIEDEQANVEQIRQMDLQRLDTVLSVLYPKVKKGDLKAIKEFRAVIDQRSRLLGTYAARKVEHSGRIEGLITDDDRDEIRRLNEAFVASGGTGEDVIDAEVVDELDEAQALPPSSS